MRTTSHPFRKSDTAPKRNAFWLPVLSQVGGGRIVRPLEAVATFFDAVAISFEAMRIAVEAIATSC